MYEFELKKIEMKEKWNKRGCIPWMKGEREKKEQGTSFPLFLIEGFFFSVVLSFFSLFFSLSPCCR